MKLSFIIPSYMGRKFIPTLIESFDKQTNKDFEIIFIVDNEKENTSIDYLLKIKEKHKEVKLLFNGKRQERLISIIEGIKVASGEYVTFCSTKDTLKNNFVKKIVEVIDQHKPDVIEYEYLYNKSKTQPKLRTKTNTLINTRKDFSVLANTISFDFNKVIKKSLVQKVIKQKFIDGASRFAFSFTFHIILESKSYFAINSILKFTSVFTTTFTNPIRVLKSIKNIIALCEQKRDEDLLDATLHQGWLSLSIYQMQILMIAKKNTQIKTLWNSLKKLKITPNYKNAIIHNKYFDNSYLSTELMELLPKINSYKKLMYKKEV